MKLVLSKEITLTDDLYEHILILMFHKLQVQSEMHECTEIVARGRCNHWFAKCKRLYLQTQRSVDGIKTTRNVGSGNLQDLG
jgi:hypothetical protein